MMKQTFIILFFLAFQGLAQQKHFLIKKGVALYGYDPVSYFSGKPQEGKPNINQQHEGIVYRFANMMNRETFKKNPEKYIPAYGGWCAYAMGTKAEKVDIDPENFKIVGGKIHLFYKNVFTNTLDDWKEDEKNLKPKADKNWTKITQ